MAALMIGRLVTELPACHLHVISCHLIGSSQSGFGL